MPLDHFGHLRGYAAYVMVGSCGPAWDQDLHSWRLPAYRGGVSLVAQGLAQCRHRNGQYIFSRLVDKNTERFICGSSWPLRWVIKRAR